MLDLACENTAMISFVYIVSFSSFIANTEEKSKSEEKAHQKGLIPPFRCFFDIYLSHGNASHVVREIPKAY